MKEATEMGMNRTGAGIHPQMIKDMAEGSQKGGHPPGDEHALDQIRSEYAKRGVTVGSAPPPTSVKGAAKAGMEAITGKKPTVFLDKLGERLAFERSGTRLYEALLSKYDSQGSWEGGPSRDKLKDFHNEELAHFHMLHDVIESLGADPTAVTPSADVTAVTSEGIQKVISDPRVNLAESMEALLAVELVDNDAWDMLIDLAGNLGYDDMKGRFQQAKREEEEHLSNVRLWLSGFIRKDAQREL